MILLIDNYDSFTYNLLQYLEEMGAECRVVRNDGISTREIDLLHPEALVISPGPCTPNEAGVSTASISAAAGRLPVLGVCLGHQCIGAAFGGKIVRAARPMHGKSSQIHHDGGTLFAGLPNPFPAVRYHSLIIERKTLPQCLEISAETADGEIMAVRHKDFNVEGVQFHPESIMTGQGRNLLKNFLQMSGASAACGKRPEDVMATPL